MSNAAKNFDILSTRLKILHNYFANSIKIFFYIFHVKYYNSKTVCLFCWKILFDSFVPDKSYWFKTFKNSYFLQIKKFWAHFKDER